MLQIVGQTLLECERSQYGVSGGQCPGCHGWGGLVSVQKNRAMRTV